MKGTIEIAIVYCLQGLTTITGVDFNKVALSLFIVYAWQLATILVSSWLFFCGLLLVLQGWMSAVFWLCPLAVTCPLYRVPWVMIPWVSILWNRQQLYAVSLGWLRLWWNSTWVPGWHWVPLECSRMTLYFSRSVPGEACCIRVMRHCTARMSHVAASVGSLVNLICGGILYWCCIDASLCDVIWCFDYVVWSYLVE